MANGRGQPQVTEAYKKLRGSNFSKSQLSYPEDLTSASQGHYVQFFINEQANANISFSGATSAPSAGSTYGGAGGTSTLSVKRAPTKRISSSIALYMPAQVSLSQDAKYGEVEIGAATAAAIAAYKGFQDRVILVLVQFRQWVRSVMLQWNLVQRH